MNNCKKVLLVNLNVSGGIEIFGNIIKSWLLELFDEKYFLEYKIQTIDISFFKFLIDNNPDIIFVNEIFPRIIIPLLYYKTIFSEKIIILFAHDKNILFNKNNFNSLNNNDFNKGLNINYLEMQKMFFNICNLIYAFNFEDLNNKINNVKNFYYPINPNLFDNKVDFINRNNFCILGSIYPLKICLSFLKNILNTDLKIDVYGNFLKHFYNDNEEYKKYLEKAFNKNLIYKGHIDYNKVGEILNNYKFCIFPHEGSELICFSLYESIACGTIPILLNDENSQLYNGKWINKKLDGLYYMVDKIDYFINNLILLNNELNSNNKDFFKLKSIYISEEIKKRFNYLTLKNIFFEDIKKLIK